MEFSNPQKWPNGTEGPFDAHSGENDKIPIQSQDQLAARFEEIRALADGLPIKGKRIALAPQMIRDDYIASLFWLFIRSSQVQDEKLFYLCRLASGCDVSVSLEGLYYWGLSFDQQRLATLSEVLQEYRQSYLVDALILINLDRGFSDDAASVVADMADLLACGKEEMQVNLQRG